MEGSLLGKDRNPDPGFPLHHLPFFWTSCCPGNHFQILLLLITFSHLCCREDRQMWQENFTCNWLRLLCLLFKFPQWQLVVQAFWGSCYGKTVLGIYLVGIEWVIFSGLTFTLLLLVIQVGITSHDGLTTTFIDSHGFNTRVQSQRSQPHETVSSGTQCRRVWLVEKIYVLSVQKQKLPYSRPGCCDVCGSCNFYQLLTCDFFLDKHSVQY